MTAAALDANLASTQRKNSANNMDSHPRGAKVKHNNPILYILSTSLRPKHLQPCIIGSYRLKGTRNGAGILHPLEDTAG